MLLIEVKRTSKTNPNDYRIFVDLDGVTADFQKAIQNIVPDYTDDKYEASSKYRSLMWKTVHHYQKTGRGFWEDLEPMPDAHTLWSYIMPYHPEVLTATGNPEYNAGKQKVRWVAKNIGPDIKVNITRKAADKAQFAAPNHILIDDKEKALKPWRAAGGIGILHTSATKTIAELKKLGL